MTKKVPNENLMQVLHSTISGLNTYIGLLYNMIRQRINEQQVYRQLWDHHSQFMRELLIERDKRYPRIEAIRHIRRQKCLRKTRKAK